MREQLIQYVNLLFAGNDSVEDIKQEILQNTLDRYDDLIDQGKTQEAAYRLAIAGIGDINEILNPCEQPEFVPTGSAEMYQQKSDLNLIRIMRAIAIGLYILSPIPLIVMDMIGLDIFGLCGTLAIVAIATVIICIFRQPEDHREDSTSRSEEDNTPQGKLKQSIKSLFGAVTLAVYLIISFATGAWHVTWLVFPIAAAVRGLINACIDLKEAE